MKIEEILSKHSKNYGAIEGNPRAIVKSTEALEAMKEFGKYIIEQSIEEMRKMQSAKYNAGETGYIDNEWRHILKEELKKKLL